MARAADQFRQSDVVKWGAAAAAAAVLALLCANVSALVPDSSFALLHNSRAINQQTSALNAEVAALNGSKSNLLRLATSEQELQRADAQLSGRLDGIEQAALSDRKRLGAVEAALPRLVNTVPISGTDSSLITGSISESTPGFKAVESEPPALTAPDTTAPITAGPAADQAAAPIVAPPMDLPAAAAAGPQWNSITSLPVFATPGSAAPTADMASIGATYPLAVDTAPFPMTPRASGTRAPTVPAVALAPAAPPAAHPDVKAIGVAVGSPMQPSEALASWQQIAERVGVMLVGMSPLLADDPAGSPGKVLVAGPVASIAAATKLCAAIDRSGLSCMPMPYVGSELTPTAAQ